MKTTLGASAVALLLGACASAPPAVLPTWDPATRVVPDAGEVRPNVIEHRLGNGLTTYLLPDESAPLAAIEVWVRVGSVNEREAGPGEDHGITGLSHFFEHMMFQGTTAYPNFDQTVMTMGAKVNAFTFNDATAYWENAPAQHLEELIKIEADRFEHMKVDFLHLEPEREVVKGERRRNTDNDAASLAAELQQARAFTTFPYHWDTIGWMSDLNAITLDEAQAYHHTWYVPNNVFLVIAGDFDVDRVKGWVEQYWGHLPSRPLPSTDFPPEPPQTETRRDLLVRPTQATTVLLGFRAPAATSRDFAVLELIDRVLAGGKSARLLQRLVYADPPKLSRLSSSLFSYRYPFLHRWRAQLLPGVTTREIEQAIFAEVAAIAEYGVGEDELARAIAGLRADVVQQTLSNQQRADLLGFSVSATDSPYTFFDRLAVYDSVTQDELKRVADTVLDRTNATIVTIVAPRRISALAASLVAATPDLDAAHADTFTSAVALALARIDHARAAAEIKSEGRAIELLEGRAEAARRDAPEGPEGDELRSAIDDYLTDNEMGVVKRTERLAVDGTEVEAQGQTLKASKKALTRAVKAIKNAGLRSVAAVMLAEDKDPLKLAAQVLPAALDDKPLALAQHALTILRLDAAGLQATAQKRRAWALGELETLLGDPDLPEPLSALVADTHALLWDTQIIGKALSDGGITVKGAQVVE